MGGYGRCFADNERFDINICNQNSSEKGGGPELQRSHAEHVSDDFSHCENLCVVSSVVGESSDRNKRAGVRRLDGRFE